MEREDAISMISNNIMARLSAEERNDLINEWWGVDIEDIEFKKLPEILQVEMMDFDEPQFNIIDTRYNSLLGEAIKHQFVGAKNTYLAEYISHVFGIDVVINGEEETLLECRCCSYLTIRERGNYEICPVCFWEDDGEKNASEYSNANHMTLSEGRINFQENGSSNKDSEGCIITGNKEKYYLASER